ncbi:porin [Allopusillimonas ginsengisoli]|uniref:porin n=1 Tax=Allopusillimonas ginsengisoli TaxID=453575 RepID=UPI0010208CF8|nr:porin [Allopusillimonas ginsengisoli]TEA78494.1 porin [Allopusillimonas ginsengisoli]
MKGLPLMIALAVQAGVAALSFAQEPGVTLYGTVDAAVVSTHTQGANMANRSSHGLTSGGFSDSLFGLQGNASLAQGWRAEFMLESRIDAATGQLDDQAALFNNSAWLGVANERFGSLRLGRQQPVSQQFFSQLEVAPWKDMGMGATLKASDNYALNNDLTYLSPSLGGLSAGVGYSFDVLGSQVLGRRSPHGSLALRYEYGPWVVVVSWDKTWLSDTALADARDPSAWQWGLAYDMGIARVSLAWSRQRNGYVGLNGGDPDALGMGLGAREFAFGGHLDAYLVGMAMPVGSGDEMLLQWSYVRPNWHWSNGKAPRPGQLATLGYVHALSPRVRLYAMGGFARRYSLDDQVIRDQGNTARYMMGMNYRF